MATATEAPAGSMAEGPTQHTQNQASGLMKLREEFPRDQIQGLPKITCGACSKSPSKECNNPQHSKSKCRECGNWITSAHMHLDYVGHAELTNRLLEADLLWDWEPLALDERGLPRFDGHGGLWIRLTVCGHSRLGYGDSQGKNGPNAVKEAIGDALRNAAMRFGAALDLWAKSDLKVSQLEHPKSAEEDAQANTTSGPASQRAATRETVPDEDTSEPAEGEPDRLPLLMKQIADCWHNRLALVQIQIEGKQKGLSGRRVQGPPPEHAWSTFDELVDGRIQELKSAAEGGATEGNAA